jgi:muramoyltetrapeptide carboxypeptidase
MEHFRRTVMQSQKAGRIAQPPANTSKEVERTNRVISIVKGKASGALVGGNLTLVTNLMGTPYEIDTKGKILFLEEVGEEPYRVDRMLTQLWLGGKFQDAAGIALGRFANCESKEYKPSFWTTFSVEQVIRDRFMPLGKPTLYNLMFGHVKENAVLPLGVMATLDATAKTLTLDESAVI